MLSHFVLDAKLKFTFGFERFEIFEVLWFENKIKSVDNVFVPSIASQLYQSRAALFN